MTIASLRTVATLTASACSRSVALSNKENYIIAVSVSPVPQPSPAVVTIELGGRTVTGEHHPDTTILQTARELGLSPPYSCEAGNCATCMAELLEGTVEMRVNDVLSDQEVADGFVLTCQSVPTSPVVRVTYEY